MWRTVLLGGCVGWLAANALATEERAIDEKNKPNAQTADAQAPSAPESWWRDVNRWSFQGGIGFITESSVDDVGTLRGELAEGDAAGQIHLLQVSYKAAQLKPRLLLHPVELDVELPLVLGVVDENGRQPFMQYSGGLALRWKTFPWNNWLYTNLETGVGLTYSQRVLAIERERHPERERSHLEFYWPVQLMLALPRHREHQLVLFLHHHSGGGIFHRGGANSLGVGYRYVPGERSRAVAE